MGKSSSKITVGYWYHPAFHMGLNMGPIDALLEVRGGDLTAWSGELTASGTITINAPNLWGGEKDQGGIAGDADVMFGEPTQQPNQYLIDTFGPQQSGWRGFTTFVWKGGRYGALNPYPQKISFKGRKIKKGWDGDPGDGSACWYPEKAEVQVSASLTLPENADGWDYQILPYAANPGTENLSIPTDGWTVDGQGPFSSNTGDTPAGNVTWPQDTILWVRRTLTVAAGSNQTLTVIAENGCVVLVNGAIAGAVNRSNVQIDNNQNNTFTFPVQSGQTYEIAIKAFDEHPSTGGTFLSASIAAPGLTAMNPAHVLYYARTQAHMGREPTVNIDDASHRVAADWFYAQGFGICPEFDASQESPAAYIERIEKVAGCSQSRSPIDGKWYLDVANGEYTLADLPILTDDDILEFNKQPTILDNAVNSVSVKYRDTQLKTSPTTPPVQALALVTQFGTIHQDVTYNEIPASGLALRVAGRELLNTTTPTNGFDLVTNRAPYAWRRGSYFRLQTPKRGIADMVCMVAGNDSGTLPSGAIKLTAAQDIYSLPATSFVAQEPGVDTRPSPIPLGIMDEQVFEAPYIEVVRTLSRADLAALPTDVGYLMTVAKDPATSRDYTIRVSTDGGSTYSGADRAPWCPTALVVEGDPLTDAAPVTEFTLAGGVLLAGVQIGSAAMWGNEWCRVDALDTTVTPNTITLGRGCADTVPAPQAANSRIWFYDGFAGKATTEYTDAETIDVELLTNTGSAQLDPSLAAAIPLTFDQRQARPYPPANVQINGDWYPSAATSPISLTFNNRDRVGQADQLLDYSAASVGPEAGVTYTLRGYLGATLDATVAGQAGSPITWNPSSTGAARVELVSVRNGIESNVWEHVFNVNGVVAMTTTPTASVAATGARISLRAAAAATVAMKYSLNADLSAATTTSAVAVDDTTDFTGAVDVAGLSADTVYYYTPKINGEDQYTSGFPTFKTFPAAGAPASFSFAFGSCTKHSGVGDDSIFDAVPAGVRFLMHIGDTIYADDDTPVATTLAEYRTKHQFALAGGNATTNGWQSLRAAQPVFTMWDDHEIVNDFSGGTGDARYAPAKQAFQEYHGRANPEPLASGELYYTFQYGDVGFFVADLRSFRSANTATDNASKTILGATQKAALKDWLLTNKDTLAFKFICASVPAHGYAAFTAGDSWGGIDDSTQAPNSANGFRTERNEIWDYIDANEIPGVMIISGDQHWAGSFKTTYASRPRYEFMATPFNAPLLTPVSRAADSVNGPVFWKYGDTMNVGVVTVDTTASPPTVSFQLYGPSGSLGSSYLTALDRDQIDLDLVPVPGITLTADLPNATVGAAYTGSVTATNTGGATGAITLTDDALPAGLTLGARTGTGPFTWPITGTPTAASDNGTTTTFSASNGTQTQTLGHTWAVAVGTLWTPADLAVPPALWVNDTSAITTDTSGNCSQWNDISGHACHITQNSQSRDPAITPSGQNGKRILTFNNANNTLLNGNTASHSIVDNIAACSIFVAGKPTKNTSATLQTIFYASTNTAASSTRAGIWIASSQVQAYQRRQDSDAAVAAVMAQPDSNWHLYSSEHNWTGQTVGIRMDGGTLTSTATGQGSANCANSVSQGVGLMGNVDNALNTASGGIGEIIVLNYIPTDAERQQIEGYIEWRWGTQTNLPSGHPYKSAAPLAT